MPYFTESEMNFNPITLIDGSGGLPILMCLAGSLSDIESDIYGAANRPYGNAAIGVEIEQNGDRYVMRIKYDSLLTKFSTYFEKDITERDYAKFGGDSYYYGISEHLAGIAQITAYQTKRMVVGVTDGWIGMNLIDSDSNSISFSSITSIRCGSLDNPVHVLRANKLVNTANKVCAVDITVDSFRNLLNKVGKDSNNVGLILLDNKLGAVSHNNDTEAYDVISYYKAGNLETLKQSSVNYCDTPYSGLYDFLYKRKNSDMGLFSLLAHFGISNIDVMSFGIMDNGKMFLEVGIDGGKFVIQCPRNTESSNSPSDSIKIVSKAFRNSSNRVPARSKTGSSFKEEPIVTKEPTVVETTDELNSENTPLGLQAAEEERIAVWREVHIQNGGTSEDPMQWFQDYALYVLQQGESIPDIDMTIVSKL